MHSDSQIYQPENINQLDDIIKTITVKPTFIAGGTDLLVQNERWQNSDLLINLESVEELSCTFESRADGILIGAALPLSKIICNSVVKERFPILVQACRQIGSVQIQNRATLGGNIANASPAGDSLPVLSVLEAQLWIGPRQEGQFEKFLIDDIMAGPGELVISDKQYIAFIFIPFYDGNQSYWYFKKVGQRATMAISKLSLAVLGWIHDQKVADIRLCTGSVSPKIARAAKTEALLDGKRLSNENIECARKQIMEEVNPITDIRSDAEYRRRITGELLREAMYQWRASST